MSRAEKRRLEREGRVQEEQRLVRSVFNWNQGGKPTDRDRSICLPQPNPMFEPTYYYEGVGLNHQNFRTNSNRENLSTKQQIVTVQAATIVGAMKSQTLCFRPIDKNRASTHTVRSSRREHVCDCSTVRSIVMVICPLTKDPKNWSHRSQGSGDRRGCPSQRNGQSRRLI